VVTKRGDIGN